MEGVVKSVNKRIKSTFPFGKCNVCNDKATGVHYGVPTCEGCKHYFIAKKLASITSVRRKKEKLRPPNLSSNFKGFFKRSTMRKENYQCSTGTICTVTPTNRNRCKACRYRRCINVGMSIESVKMGRIPKAARERALALVATSNSKNQNDKSYLTTYVHDLKQNINLFNEVKENGTIAIKSTNVELILDTGFYEYGSFFPTKRKTFQMVLINEIERNFGLLKLEIENLVASKNIPLNDKTAIETIINEIFQLSLVKIVNFIYKIPGFTEIDMNDLILMLKIKSYILFIMIFAPFIIENESTIRSSGDFQMNRFILQSLFDESVTSKMFESEKLYNELNLTDAESGLLIASLITCPCDKFKHPFLIHHLHENFALALKNVFQINGRDQVFIENFNYVVLHSSKLIDYIPANYEALIQHIQFYVPCVYEYLRTN